MKSVCLALALVSLVLGETLQTNSEVIEQSERQVGIQPIAFFGTYWESQQRPQGPLTCYGYTSVTLKVVIKTGDTHPNLAVLTTSLNEFVTLVSGSAKTTYGSVIEDATDGILTVVLGSLPALATTTVQLSFLVTTDKYYGTIYISDLNSVLTIDEYTINPKLQNQEVYFDCQDNTLGGFVVVDDSDLTGGEIAAVVILSIFAAILLIALLLLLLGRGGSQSFTGAGPSQWRENPDG